MLLLLLLLLSSLLRLKIHEHVHIKQMTNKLTRQGVFLEKITQMNRLDLGFGQDIGFGLGIGLRLGILSG